MSIKTRCPACRNETLVINDGRLLCTWHVCPNPTLIDELGEKSAIEVQVLAKLDKICSILTVGGDKPGINFPRQ